MANAVFISYSCSPLGIGKITGTTKSGITWTGSTSMSATTYLTGGTILQWTAQSVSRYNVSFQAQYYLISKPDDPVTYSGSFTSMTLGTNWKKLEIQAVYSSVGPSSYNVTFSSTAAEGSISPSGTISYNSGTTVQVTAQANAGYRFNVWTGNYLSGGTGLADNFKTATANLTVNKTGTVTANYWPAYRCDATSADTSKGTVVKTYSNTQGPWGNIPLYDNNASITLTATATTNYEFANWTDSNTGTALSTSNPYTFSLTVDKYITGNFRGATKTISTSVSPSNTGTTTVSGSTRYGEVCTVSATPSSHYHFVNWTEGGTPVIADNPWSFIVTGNRTLVANMAIDTHSVAVSVNNSSMGTASGSGTYNYGTTVTVSATAKTGYHFVQWTNTGTGTTASTNASYSFTVSGNISLRADFAINSYTITASSNNTNRGTVSGGGSYNYNSTCTLVGAPKTGYQFQNWTEGSTSVSTTTPYSFTVTAARTIVGNFIPLTYTISASASPAAGGSVSGTGTKDYGSSVTLTATANSNYNFVNWTEGGTQVSTSAPYTFTCTGARTLVANFELKSYNVTVSAGTGGTVSGGGSYVYNTTATVYATPLAGYQFTNWTEGSTIVSTSASYSFTVTAAKSLTANFSAVSSATDGLLVWLPLTDGIVNKGLSNTVMTNYSCTVNTSGKLGNCYTFTGSSYINGTLSNFNKDCWSVACWALATTSSSSWHQYMVSLNGSSASDFTFTLCWYGNVFGVRTGNTTYSSTVTGLTNIWTHVCATYDGSTLKLYINGALNKTVSSPVAPVSASGLFLGMRGGSAGQFTGKLNDIRIYNYTLSQKEVSEISKGLILHYKLNRVNSNGYTYDCSGNGHKGSNTGSLTTSASTPRYNKSTICSGSNYISTTSPTTEAKTFSVWANWDSIPSGQSIIYVDLKSKTGLGLMSSGILCSCNGLNSNTFSKSSISASTWYHFVVVCPNGGSDASRKLYINGVEQTSTTSTSNWTFSLDQLQVGKRSTTSDGFAGKLSDFRIYATALSDADIQELYNTSMTIDDNGNTLPRELFESVGDNFFTSEKIQSYAFNITSSNNHGQWVDRNGQAAMKISPSNAFYANSTYAHIFEGLFEEDTSYVFDMYIDADDAFYNGSYRNGGFRIYYSDDTSYTGFIVTGGDGVGFQHKTFITPADKTVSYITINYNVNNPIYYRWGSTITKYDTAFITKTGLFEPTQLIEGNNLSSLIEGGEEYCNKLEEY